MKEISITGSGLSTMCRLCLSSDVVLLDIFWFSSEMRSSVAGVIMKRAAVQMTRGDEMPNFICQSCYTQLEKTHQFLTQIELSDRTLRRYIQQLYASDKPIKAEWSVEPFEDPLILNKDTGKCESSELKNGFDMDLNWKETGPRNFIRENKNNEEMCFKSEIKVELVDDNLFIPTECASVTEDTSSIVDGYEFSCEDSKIDIGETKVSEGMTVSWKEKEQENNISTNKMEEMSLKSEINDEKMDDNLLILTESVDSNGNGNEITCEDTKINIGHTSENVTENFSKCDETKKNISVKRKKHKKTKKLNSYQCDIRNKCVSGSSGLNKHKRTHTGEKPYKCNVCARCFSRLFHLNRHKLTHTGEKPYQCDICKKCFSRLYSLNNHKRLHTGEKPYQCDICKKCFSQSSHLNNHKRLHTDAKTYECDFCKKCFSDPSTLNKHKRIHTGEKPYKCDRCNQCYSQSSSLNKHKLIHTGEKPYKCDRCNKCFSQSSSLNKHKKRIHTGEQPYQ